MALGKNILKLRKKSGLSQEQLGEKINVSRQTISNWELGETSPNIEQLKLISKELNVSLDELLNNDNNIELKKEILETKNKQKKKLNSWKVLLLIILLIICLPLLITIFSILLSIYIELWTLIICFWIFFCSTLFLSLSMLLLGIPFGFGNTSLTGLAMICIGMISMGLSILLFFGNKVITKAILLLTKKIILNIKNYFSKREVA